MPLIPTTSPYYPYVKSADEIWSGRSGDPLSLDGVRNYTRKYKVVVTDKDVAEIVVCTSVTEVGGPALGDVYLTAGNKEHDLLAVMVRARAEPQDDDDWQVWIVTFEYSTELPEGGMPDFPAPPTGPGGLGRPSRSSANEPETEAQDFRWTFEVENRAHPRDLDGKPYVNSARQPLHPAPTVQIAFPVFEMSRNERAFHVGIACEYSFALNSDTFLGRPPKTVIAYPPSAQLMIRGTLRFWRVSYKFKFMPPCLTDYGWTFQPEFLDQGTCELQDDAGKPNHGKPVPIIRDGAQLTTPDLLDGAGKPVLPDQNGFRQPRFIKRRMYLEKPFTPLLRNGYVGPVVWPPPPGP